MDSRYASKWPPKRQRWIVLVGFYLLVISPGLAQSSTLSPTALDQLPTWRPTRRAYLPHRLPDTASRANEYRTLVELTRRTKQGTALESLVIDEFILEQGGLSQLSAFRSVRALYVHGLRASQADSLVAMVRAWPRLERLSMNLTQHWPTPAQAMVTHLPSGLQHCPRLRELSITENGLDWSTVLPTLAQLKPLRRLEIRHQRDTDHRLPGFAPLSQLQSLQLSGWLVGPHTFQGLGHLTDLTLISDQLDPNTFQSTLDQLPRLESLIVSNCRSLASLRLSRLKRLKKVELTYNDDLRVEEATLAGLARLKQLTVRSPLKSISLAGLCSSPQLEELIVGGSQQPSPPSLHLPACLDQFRQLIKLQIENLSLGQLLSGIGSLRHLQDLQVRQCRLASLPATLSQLTALRTLVLQADSLQHLPALGRLRALQELDVSNNGLTALPPDLGQLVQLTSLDVSTNRLAQLPPSFSKLSHLRQCWLSNNRLRQLPSELGELGDLAALTIGDNQLTDLPPSLGQLVALRFLSIGRNQLTGLPASFTQLGQLTDVHLGPNPLEALPAAIGQLDQLQTVSIQGVPITALPPSFCGLTQLVSLSLTNTRLRRLPDQIGALGKLRFVSLANNHLTTLPGSIRQWHWVSQLDLTGNPLDSLPNGLGQMASLTELLLAGRKPTGISGRLTHLPDSIVGCTQLAVVSLEDFPQLKADELFRVAAQLKSLRELTAVNCQVKQLPRLVWRSIPWQRLILDQNQLTDLPPAMMTAPNLRYLSLRQNRLPDALNRLFENKQALLSAFAESDRLAPDSAVKPNPRLGELLLRTANEKGSSGDWAGAVRALGKAIEYAPDSMRSLAYGERASLHEAHQHYSQALADIDSALAYLSRLQYQGVHSPASRTAIREAHLKYKGRILATMGRYEAALASVALAQQLLPADPFPTYAEHVGSNEIDRGRYLAYQGQFDLAAASYRRAVDAYQRALRSHVGIQLKTVELCLLTGQYERAQGLLGSISLDTSQGGYGYATVQLYLQSWLAIVTGKASEQPVLEGWNAYLVNHPDRIYNWRREPLVDRWLTHLSLTPQQIRALGQLSALLETRLGDPVNLRR